MAQSQTPIKPDERTESAKDMGGSSSHRPDRMLDESPIAPGTRNIPTREEGDLQLPHERDQSVGGDSTGGMGTGAAGQAQREVMQQAHQDLQEGQVDTDLRATPGLDAEGRKQIVDDPKAAPVPRGSVAEHGKSGHR